MNILKYPDEAPPDAIVTRAEFEELAIHAGWMEDLMDKSFPEPDEFINAAIQRANAVRTPQNLHLWVAGPKTQSVFLVRASLLPGINRANALARAMSKQVDILNAAIREIIAS